MRQLSRPVREGFESACPAKIEFPVPQGGLTVRYHGLSREAQYHTTWSDRLPGEANSNRRSQRPYSCSSALSMVTPADLQQQQPHRPSTRLLRGVLTDLRGQPRPSWSRADRRQTCPWTHSSPFDVTHPYSSTGESLYTRE